MNKLLLIVPLFCISFISFSQTEKQKELREKYQEAPERVYLNKSSLEQNRSNRAVIFYDDFSTSGIWTMTNTSSPSHDWIINDSMTPIIQFLYDTTLHSTSGGNFALLDCFSQGNSTQNANITTTNSFDCSSSPNVLIRFENFHMKSNEIHSVQVSNDGNNFDTYLVNTNYVLQLSDNTEEVTINISATAANEPTVWIRFNYSGIGFFWAIDDVSVEDIPQYDLEFSKSNVWNATIDPIFGSRLDYSVVPVSQIDSLVIGGTLTNYGLSTTDSSALKYVITNSSSIIIDSGYSNFSPLSTFDSLLDSAIYNPTTAIGNYTISSTGFYDSLNQNASIINSYSETYKVVNNSGTGSQYARDNDIPSGYGLWNGTGNGYIMGNTFYVYNNITAYTIDVCFNQDTDPGVVACIMLYEVDTTTGANLLVIDQCLDGVEYTLSANNLSTPSTMNWQRFCLNASTPFPVLEAGKLYIAAVSHYGGTEQMVIQDGGVAVDPLTSWIFDQTDATWYYMMNKPKIRFGFDMPFYCISSVEENISGNLYVSQNFPNPANETTDINYSLEIATNVSIEVINITGKIIFSQVLGNKPSGLHSFNLNTSNFADGIYFYSMTAGSDKITKKLTVSR